MHECRSRSSASPTTCAAPGAEERHVEVKGTTGAATSVELTVNEVLHARDKDNTVDLYVVSDIRVDTVTDPYTASGGTVSHYPD
ncbi:protein NO VEIN domain-containing protein [Streptomyces sp. SAS_270]|uniref:protein NO VEIN domain-containing protein n=1 Tax=Streptomyces sp. SAS_270 TaxID=3412748 RepID=UPI00403CD3F7